MALFGSPFSSLANDRKLTDAELIRAIRFMVAAEYEATQLYMQLAESTDNKLAVAVLKDIANRGTGTRWRVFEITPRACPG